MSKKIKHEQARKFLNASYQAIVQKYGSGIQKSNAIMEEDFWTAYINQQEKQEKLLELYKELIIELDLEFEEFERFGDKAKNPALDKLRIKNTNFVFEGKAPSLFKQIKELENDKN